MNSYTVQFTDSSGLTFYATVVCATVEEAVAIVQANYPWGVDVRPALR